MLHRLISLFIVLSGKGLAQGSQLVCGVVIARVTGPAEFLLYATMLSLVLLLDACLGSPLDYTVVRFAGLHPDDPARTTRLQALTFRIKIVLGLVLVGLALLSGHWVATRLLHDPARSELVLIAAASTFALLIMRSLAAYLQAQGRFRAYSTLDMAQGTARILLVVLLARAGVMHAEWYFASFAGASVVLFLISLWMIPQPYLLARWPTRIEAREIVRFVSVTTGVVILGTITGRTDLLLLTAFAPAGMVSQYAAAAQLATIATLLAGYASVVVQPMLIPAARRGQLPRLLLENLILAFAVAVAIQLIVWPAGNLIMGRVFGPGFATSGWLLRILLAGTCIDLLCMPVAMTFVLQVRPHTALICEAVITAAFLCSAPHVAVVGVAEMAWLVTAIRGVKAVVYIGATLADMGREAGIPVGRAVIRR